MTWKPASSSPSVEDFDSPSGFTLPTGGQVDVRGGTLQLVGTLVEGEASLSWKDVDWTQTSEFIAYPTADAPRDEWALAGDNLDTSEFPFEGEVAVEEYEYVLEEEGPAPTTRPHRRRDRRRRRRRRHRFRTPGGTPVVTLDVPAQRTVRVPAMTSGHEELALVTTGTEIRYVSQETSSSNDYFPVTVNNATGYTLELRAKVRSGTQRLLIDDGTYRESLLLTPTGVMFGARLVLSVPWDEDPQSIRIGVQSDDLYLLSEQGQSWIGTSQFTSDPVETMLLIGSTSDTPGDMTVDYLYQAHDGVHMDVETALGLTYPTNEFTSVTPAYSPKRRVTGFGTMRVRSSDGFAGGTLQVLPQYLNSGLGSWQDFGSPVTVNQENQGIDLSTIPVASDATDEVRFQFRHQAGSSATRPARVTQLSLSASFTSEAGDLRLNPESGSVDGGYVVELSPRATLPPFTGTDQVFVDGVALDSSAVEHVSTVLKRVTWPAGDAGIASVEMEIGGDTSTADRPFLYVESYDKNIDRAAALAGIAGTKSPFRIKHNVPDGEVNLAYLSAPGVESDAYLGVIDLSHLELANVVPGAEAPFFAEPDTSEAGVYTYQGMETEDLVVAVSCASWRELSVPAPLFYKYLIGRGRFYVHTPLIGGSPVLEEIRSSIHLHDGQGTAIPPQDYPWDVVVSTVDADGTDLPDGIYSVVILTMRRSIPGQSVFVTYPSADRSNRWSILESRTEVMNPVPAVPLSGTPYGMDITFEGENSYELAVRT